MGTATPLLAVRDLVVEFNTMDGRVRAVDGLSLRVRQGETIAYVGMTGLATGPHLHYEYRLNGRYLDPQHLKLPDAAPLDPALLADFRLQTAPLLAALDAPATPATLAAR